MDTPVALKIARTPTSSYRSVIYVNGWQFGRFNSRDGPQEVFAVCPSPRVLGIQADGDVQLPEGILNHNGKNELLLTLWALGEWAHITRGSHRNAPLTSHSHHTQMRRVRRWQICSF